MAQPSQPNPAGVSAGAPGTAAPVSNPTVKPAETPAAGGQPLSILQHLQNVGSDSNALKWILGTAAAGGLTGGLLSAQGGLRPGETPGQRRKRILLNVLGSSAAGGTIPAALFASKDFIGNEPDLHAPTARDKYNAMHGGFAASPLAKGLYSAVGGTYGYMKGKKMDYHKALKKVISSDIFKTNAVGGLEHATAGTEGIIANIANAEKGSRAEAVGQNELLKAMGMETEAGSPKALGALRALRVDPIKPTTQQGNLFSRLFHGQGNSWSPARGMEILDRGRVGGVLGMTAGAMAPLLVNFGVHRGVALYNNKETEAPTNPGIWDYLTHGKALNSD